MKYTIDTVEKTIELEVSKPESFDDLISNLKKLKELYPDFLVNFYTPPVGTFNPGNWGFQPEIQPCTNPQPNGPWDQPSIVYCSKEDSNNAIGRP